jgi:hypothetical protein
MQKSLEEINNHDEEGSLLQISNSFEGHALNKT